MQAKLVVVGGDAKAGEIQLKLPAIIGRGRDATLTLPHPLVSRQHCEIFEVNGRLSVRDLGSLNGTFVGNQRITEAPLPSGELLTIGNTTFRAVYGESDAAVNPPVRPSDETPVPPTTKPAPSPIAATPPNLTDPQAGTEHVGMELPGLTTTTAAPREAIAPKPSKPTTPAAKAPTIGTKTTPAAAPPTAPAGPMTDDLALELLEEEPEEAPAAKKPGDAKGGAAGRIEVPNAPQQKRADEDSLNDFFKNLK